MARIKEIMRLYDDFDDELKTYLGFPTGAIPEDVQWSLWFGGTVMQADTFVDRNFKELLEDECAGEGTGEDIDWIDEPEHAGIKVFVFNVIGILQQTLRRPFGMTSVRTRDLSRSFAIGSRIAGGEVTLENVARTQYGWLRPSRLVLM